MRIRTYSLHVTSEINRGCSLKMTFPLLPVVLLSFLVSINARPWNDTGSGTIIFEEAWTIPELIDQQTYVIS